MHWSYQVKSVERERKLKEAIRQRLGPVCEDFTAEQFEELVEKVAKNQLKSDYGYQHLA